MQSLRNLVALLVGMSIGMLLALSMDAKAADTTTIITKVNHHQVPLALL